MHDLWETRAMQELGILLHNHRGTFVIAKEGIRLSGGMEELLRDWNRIYTGRGFVIYSCLPEED